MAINLLSIQPHKVSRDLSGYFTYLYGPGGSGKTTFAASAPRPLIIAFERGYNALPGVFAQDVNTWGEMKQILRELKKPEVKARFSTIAIDTVDLASVACEKYVCGQLDIENIGDGGWTTNGWAKVKREWEQTFKEVAMLGYAIIFISHAKDKTFTRKDNTTYNQIVPSCSTAYNEIIKNMVDLMGYIDVNQGERQLVLRSADGTIDCKSRFKYIDPVIPFSYQSLVDALNKAIDKEAQETNGQYVTENRSIDNTTVEYNYDALMAEFQDIVGQLMNKGTTNSPKITAIVEKYLGKGKKVSDTSPNQAEFIFLIVEEIKSDLM